MRLSPVQTYCCCVDLGADERGLFTPLIVAQLHYTLMGAKERRRSDGRAALHPKIGGMSTGGRSIHLAIA